MSRRQDDGRGFARRPRYRELLVCRVCEQTVIPGRERDHQACQAEIDRAYREGRVYEKGGQK